MRSGTISIFIILVNIEVLCQAFDPKSLNIMFYNVENAFDIRDDSTTDDNDFLPGGVMRWNLKRYNAKITSLYKTIISAGEWNPPEIICLCEIENRKILGDLVYGSYLSKYNYGIIHEDSPDRRGIDVCLIFRKDVVKAIKHSYWRPAYTDGEFTTREVLYTVFEYQSDTFHLIVNHWPSRKGGVLAGEDLRKKIAGMIRFKTDSISAENKNAKILITGDFNCTPDDSEMRYLTSGENKNALVNLSADKALKGKGTYRYMGTWEMIDQLLVSESLLNSREQLHIDRNEPVIFRPDFLLREDSKYPGPSPFSTFRGYRYQGGFSDHLPIIFKLQFILRQD